MSAAFKFKQYRVVNLSYESNLIQDGNNAEEITEENSEEKAAEYSINISNIVSVNSEDKHKYRCELRVDVSGSANAEVVLYGYFEATSFYSDDDYEREHHEISPISISILLPIARSIMATLSCQDGSKPILIPVVNIDEMITVDDS